MKNFEYKIFTKIIVNRLKKYSHLFFKDFQTCSIKGRRINDSINLIRDVIFDAEKRGKNYI